MAPGAEDTRAGRVQPAKFELERFAWTTPDRLEVAGKFKGLADAPAEPPVLFIEGDERVQLPVVPGTRPGPPEDGRSWRAEFAWQGPPVAFESAELAIGDEILVSLPEPGSKRPLLGNRVLEVRRAPVADAEAAAVAGGARDDAAGSAGTDRLRLHAELLRAQEEARELRAALEQSQAELERTREDLAAERRRHAADAERYREGLATVQRSAEEALAAERSAAAQLGSDLRAAHDVIAARDTALEQLRARLEASAAAGREVEELRSHVTALRDTVDAASADANALLDRLTNAHDASDGER